MSNRGTGPDFSDSPVGSTKKVCLPGDLPEGYVAFRPKKNWYGEYGFDWMREGDYVITSPDGKSLSNLNVKFSDIVGHHTILNPATGATDPLNPDANFGSMSLSTPFQQDSALFSTLESGYAPSDVSVDGGSVRTYSAYLSIFRKEEEDASLKPDADIVAKVFINPAEPPPDELILDYDTSLLSVTPALTVSGTLNTPSEQSINVKCLTTFDTDQTVTVKWRKTDECGIVHFGTMGNLTVMANSLENRRVQKILVVMVKTPDLTGTVPFPWLCKSGQLNPGEMDQFKGFLRQALVDPLIDGDPIQLDLTWELSFKSKYTQNEIVVLFGWKDDVIAYFKQKTKDMLTSNGDPRAAHVDDPNFRVAFFLGTQIGGVNPGAPAISLYGGLKLAGTNVFVMGPGRNDIIFCHEFLHSLSLPHTFQVSNFDPNATYSYQFGKTDNLMDYSAVVNGPDYSKGSFSLYKWQWELARSNSLAETGSGDGPGDFNTDDSGNKTV